MGRLGRTDNDLFGERPAAGVPSGSLVAYAGASAPTGWLLCDGSAVSRADYGNLFSAIGTAYGSGDGTTTFNVPDLRGRTAVGKNAGTFATLGATGGAETVTLTGAQSGVPAHSHAAVSSSGSSGAHSHGVSVGTGGSHSHAATTSVGSHGHNYVYPNWTTGTAANGGGTAVVTSMSAPTSTTASATPSGSTTITSAGDHSHSGGTDSAGGHTHSVSTSVSANAAATAAEAHSNLAPYAVVNYIIKT